MPEPKKPETTPQCKQLQDIVKEGPDAGVWRTAAQEKAAFAALERLRKNRCVKSLEYIIHYTSGKIGSDFWRDICEKATEYLRELS